MNQIGEGYVQVGRLNPSISFYINEKTEHKVVIKRILITQGFKELAVYKRINQLCLNGVPKLLDYWMDERYLYLKISHMAGISLNRIHEPSHAALKRHFIDRFDQVIFFAEQMLKNFHRTGYLHLDIKPENLMLDETLNLTLIDFGVSAASTEQQTNDGTLAFMAPEAVHMTAPVDELSDAFSLGMSLKYVVEGEISRLSRPGLERLSELCHQDKKLRRY